MSQSTWSAPGGGVGGVAGRELPGWLVVRADGVKDLVPGGQQIPGGGAISRRQEWR